MKLLTRGAVGSGFVLLFTGSGIACWAIADGQDISVSDGGSNDGAKLDASHDGREASSDGGRRADSGRDTGTMRDASGDSASGSEASTSSDAGLDAEAAGCFPHALPSGFDAGPHPPLSDAGCTQGSNNAISKCIYEADANATNCAAFLQTPCGQCAEATVFSNGDVSATWPALIVIKTVGANPPVAFTELNIGGCVSQVDPSSTGANCARALEERDECIYAACLPYCPVTSASDTDGMNALLGTSTTNGCINVATTTVCRTYVMTVATACATESNDAGTGALDECNALIAQVNSEPPTISSFLGLICGGVDAGI